jgi:hypothetical protein
MQSVVNQKYFFWGSARPAQFGLYSPVLDRFVIVDDTDQCLEYVCFLLSSKINLFLVPLNSAPNFTAHLIDNSCCTNWGVDHWNNTRVMPGLFRSKDSYYLKSCGTLASRHDAQPGIFELQQISFLAKYVIDYFKFGYDVMYTKFFDILTLPIERSDYRYFKKQEKHCFDLIYLSTNYEDTESQIAEIINDCQDKGFGRYV